MIFHDDIRPAGPPHFCLPRSAEVLHPVGDVNARQLGGRPGRALFRPLPPVPPLGRLRAQIQGRVDESDMAECLWEVSEHAAGDGVVFLCEQADVVA